MAKAPTFSVRPEDLEILPSGEVKIANKELLDRISGDLEMAIDPGSIADNYVGCGGNAYQCGGAMGGFDELVNKAKTLKTVRR